MTVGGSRKKVENINSSTINEQPGTVFNNRKKVSKLNNGSNTRLVDQTTVKYQPQKKIQSMKNVLNVNHIVASNATKDDEETKTGTKK